MREVSSEPWKRWITVLLASALVMAACATDPVGSDDDATDVTDASSEDGNTSTDGSAVSDADAGTGGGEDTVTTPATDVDPLGTDASEPAQDAAGPDQDATPDGGLAEVTVDDDDTEATADTDDTAPDADSVTGVDTATPDDSVEDTEDAADLTVDTANTTEDAESATEDTTGDVAVEDATIEADTDDAGPAGPANSPCEESLEPGSSDPGVTECVCALDAYCCDIEWDDQCVDEAQEECGAGCDCSGLACDTSADCGCPSNVCDGQWACVDGGCELTGALECPGSVGQCVVSTCDADAGACVETTNDEACNDFDPCTADSCNGDTAQCEYIVDEMCGVVLGDQHPCSASVAPGANDEDTVTCVCGLDAFCCESSWDAVCVTEAQTECGAVCDCNEAPVDDLGCDTTEDCLWCGEDSCNGIWTCLDGQCSPSAPVVCDSSGDTECSGDVCNPATGECELTFDDGACDDGDNCTADACDDSGDCVSEPIEGCGDNHPCLVSGTAGSSDEAVTSCVCDIDPTCCTVGWGGSCVQIAEALCGLTCDCASLPDEDKACAVDTDCAFCDDGDLCSGEWSCVDAVCASSAPIICDTANDGECAVTACVATTGQCVQAILPDLCEDGDLCTLDLCGADGDCAWQDQEGCGANHPCITSPFPSSADEEITDCVCALDGFCCSTAWDGICTGVAETQCGAVCTCDAPGEATACETDPDCAGCDDGDLCNGSWQCVDGVCLESGAAVICNPADDVGCLQNLCVPATGTCELEANVAECDDDDSCTSDACGEDGLCVHEPSGACDNHPCEPSSDPGSNDAAITACVCEVDAYCCETAWDAVCVDEVTNDCGVSCDCSDPAGLPCELDADCSFCSDDVCTGPWACVTGVCVATEPVICDDSTDSECIINTCTPDTGTCELTAIPEACDDGDLCTLDSCSEAGECVNEAQPGCQGSPPYDCLGISQPSADGCAAVDTFEGCCDPWGRVTWCDGGQTYCIDCSDNPVCGWSGGAGFYDCGAEVADEDPTGTNPYMCSAP